MNIVEQLTEVRNKIEEIKHENFGVCPAGMYMDGLLEWMWELEDNAEAEKRVDNEDA